MQQSGASLSKYNVIGKSVFIESISIFFIECKYSKLYILDENFAREEKLGMWKGTFIKPEKWRKLN